MNSGCFGNDISKVLISIKAIDINECKELEIKREEIEFFYRGTNLRRELIITSVKLKGVTDLKEKIEKNKLNLLKKRNYLNQVKLKLVEAHLKI